MAYLPDCVVFGKPSGQIGRRTVLVWARYSTGAKVRWKKPAGKLQEDAPHGWTYIDGPLTTRLATRTLGDLRDAVKRREREICARIDELARHPPTQDMPDMEE